MKTRVIRSAAFRLVWGCVAMALVSCRYDAPLASPQSLPIDSRLIGVWQAIDEEATQSPATLIVLPFTSTEYLVHYPTAADDSMYFRAYPIQVAGVACVQLELLGSHKGRDLGKTPYTLVTYTLEGDTLVVRTVNESLVSSDLTGTAALVEAFTKHASDPELFNNPGKFKRVAE